MGIIDIKVVATAVKVKVRAAIAMAERKVMAR